MNNFSKNPKQESTQSGFTVLYASIVVAIVLSLGLTIGGIFLRESLLVSSSVSSTKASYAADTGLECAMYWDRQEDAFPTSSNASNIQCPSGNNVNPDTDSSDGAGSYDHSFQIDSDELCVGVTIEKIASSSGRTFTRIEARGRDTCDNTGRQSERALRSTYYSL